jgi:preprotein translocase subunit SecA
MHQFEQVTILRAIDTVWIEQVDYLQRLKGDVLSRQSSQKEPMMEYQHESLAAYKRTHLKIEQSSIKTLMLSDVKRNKNDTFSIFFV